MDKCVLTGRNIISKREGFNLTFYNLSIANVTLEIFVCECFKDSNVDVPFHILAGLIANNKWPRRSFIITDDCKNNDPPVDAEHIILPDFLDNFQYPKNAAERLNNLLLYLFKLQTFDGENININTQEEIFWTQNYFKSAVECLFYIHTLKENGYILFSNVGKDGFSGSFRFNHKGLLKVTELIETGDNSDNCFIAMAFNDDTKIYRIAIKRALEKTGYKPILIDEEHLESDEPIPDGIIAGIKKCKFCVADFTFHRNGVYFESGFALGLGKPVIYLCKKDDFDDTHFDIKQLQHIIYSSPEELEVKLSEKIDAWIN